MNVLNMDPDVASLFSLINSYFEAATTAEQCTRREEYMKKWKHLCAAGRVLVLTAK